MQSWTWGRLIWSGQCRIQSWPVQRPSAAVWSLWLCPTTTSSYPTDNSASLSLSLRFNGHFPGEPGLACTCLLKEITMEVMVTTGAIRRAKLQSNRHHQQTNTQLVTGRMPFLSSNQQCQSSMRRGKYHIPWTCLTQTHLGSFNFVSDH